MSDNKWTPEPWTFEDCAGAGLKIYGNPGEMLGSPWGPNGKGPINFFDLVKSPEPITLAYERWVQFAPEGWDEMQAANAKRLCDCVNACSGMSDPVAEIARLRSERERLRNEIEKAVTEMDEAGFGYNLGGLLDAMNATTTNL